MIVRPLIAAVLLFAASSCASRPATSDPAEAAAPSAHAWNVYDGDELILDVNDSPGPIMSTASLPPGARPATHPFLSATAHSAIHENKLHQRLVASKSLPEFLSLLRADGFRVVPIPPAP